MKRGLMEVPVLILQLGVITLLFGICRSYESPQANKISSVLLEINVKLAQSSSMEPQPLLPLQAPSPLMPFTNTSVPELSGLCTLNFSSTESILKITATDCWSSLAPYLSDVVCCPQLDAALVILIGKSSLQSGTLGMNATQAEHCLSDVEQILEAQGSNEDLGKLCSIYPSNLTEASCPVVNVDEVEKSLDIPKIMSACEKVDPVKECCHEVCQNAITDAAERIALKDSVMPTIMLADLSSPGHLALIDDCKRIVLRWLASKLDSSSANSVLRGMSSCKTNKVCPLVLPDTENVTKECGSMMSNQTACCEAMWRYMSDLQEQRFVTNLQASNCAGLLGEKLQKGNVSHDVYDLCHVKLKDFSIQDGSRDSGCLFPSLPLDITYDQSTGIGFKCDLNDNIAAPWPSTTFAPASMCNTTTQIPALPKAISAQHGVYSKRLGESLLLFFSLILVLNQ